MDLKVANVNPDMSF